jgi:hypothetical protein
MAWPEAMAIAPEGERVALVERGEALRLRIVRAAPQEGSDGSAGSGSGSAGSVTELERAVETLPELAFADAETLVVRGATLAVFRR